MKTKKNRNLMDEGKNIFKSSPISIIDHTLKISWIASILIFTNFAIIVSKINEFNEAVNMNLNISTNILIIVLLVLFIFTMFIYYFIQWNITRISYDENKIVVYKNIGIKDRYEFLLKNISGFVVEQTLIDKLFSIYRLKIYTERMHNRKPDAHFFVKKEVAFKLKSIILSRLSGNKQLVEQLEKISDFDIILKIRNIFVHSLFSISIGNSIIILNVILLIFSMIKEGTIAKEIVTNLLGFIITIFTIVFPILYSLISSLFKFYGYQLKKINQMICVKYGLLTTKTYFIPIQKIKGVIMKETFISRFFKYKVLKVICSGVANRKGELDFLFPMVNQRKLDDILTILLPDSKFSIKKKMIYQPNFTISIFLIGLTIINIIVIPILMYLKLKTLYILIYMFFSVVILAVLYFFKRISIHENFILISTGVFLRKLSFILYDSVKYMKISEGIISDKFNIHQLCIYITSEFGNLKQSLGYVTKNNLIKIKKKCLTN